jgi:hypothetical protein
MAQIDITAKLLGKDKLRSTLQRMSAHDVPKAIKAGVRYAAGGGKTAIAKNIRAHYSLKSARIKQDISKPMFRDGGQAAVLRTSRKPPTAMQFKAKDARPKGVTMAIYKGKRTKIQGGFIAQGLPFVRTSKNRYPLDTIKGPSIHAIYTGGKFAGQIQHVTEQRMEERLVTGILRHIGRVSRGFG